MKKYVSLFLAAAAIITVASCAKVEATQEAESTHEVEFVFEEELTKTAISVDEKNVCTVNWYETPKSYIHLFENGVTGTNPQITTYDNAKIATIMATFPSVAFNYYDYRAVIAANYNPATSVATVSDKQTPHAKSFDPAADILLGKGKDVQVFRRSQVALTYKRPVAISRLTLTGIGENEKAEAIEIIASNKIAGAVKLDPSTKGFVGYDKENGSNRILLDAKNLTNNEGTVVAFFTSWAVKAGDKIAFRVKTDKRYYEVFYKDATALEFKEGVVTNIKAAVSPVSVYEPVTEAPESWAGKYIIADELCNCTSEGWTLDGEEYPELYGTVKAFTWNRKHGQGPDKPQRISVTEVLVDSFAGKKVIIRAKIEAEDEYEFEIDTRASDWQVFSYGYKKNQGQTKFDQFLNAEGKELKIVFGEGPEKDKRVYRISQEGTQTSLNLYKAADPGKIDAYLKYDSEKNTYCFTTTPSTVQLYKFISKDVEPAK